MDDETFADAHKAMEALADDPLNETFDLVSEAIQYFQHGDQEAGLDVLYDLQATIGSVLFDWQQSQNLMNEFVENSGRG